MDWETYSREFTEAAKKHGYHESYVKRCLSYAHRLASQHLPIIYSADHLAALVGYEKDYLRFVAYSPTRFYREYPISKKSGGQRLISEPLPNLMAIQRWVLDNVLYRIEPSDYAKAYVHGRSIKDNARFHRKQEKVLCLDIEAFFPSLSSKKVRKLFDRCGYSKQVSYYLTALTSLHGGLPQGAPTSPALSNILLKPIDKWISEYCIERHIRYTRYADDLTFSGTFSEGDLIAHVRKVLSRLHLNLKEEKTRLMERHQRQEVTGIVVNEKMQLPRETRRELRQATYYVKKYGLENHVLKRQEMRANYLNHLLGLANFALFVNPNDRDAETAIAVLRTVKSQMSVNS